jgi:PKD repeat protein
MRQIQISALLLCFLASMGIANAAAPPLLEWQKCLGGTGQDMPVRLIKGSDGFIYTLGSTGSSDGDVVQNRGALDLWLTKLDSTGQLIWQKTYGGSNMDIGTGIVQLSSGGFIIAGYTASTNGDITSNHGNFDAWVLKIDQSGNIIWQKTIGGSQVDLCYSLIQTQDGGFLLGGGTYSNDGDVSGLHGDQDFWLVKINSAGTIQWQRTLGGSSLDVCYGIIENNSGEIIACGATNSTNGDVTGNHGSFEFWVNKLSASGNLLWSKCYGGTEQESALSICRGATGQYLIAGYSKSANGDVGHNSGYNDFWACLIDDTGLLVKEKSFGGTGADIAYSVIHTIDGGFLLSGGTNSSDIDVRSNHGLEDVWLLKTDQNLNIEWSQCLGGTGNDRPSCAIQNSDGGYYVAAYTYSTDGDITGNHGTADFWILKMACKIPIAAFSSSTDSVCTNGSVQLINNSSNSTAYSWSVNNQVFSTLTNPSTNLGRNGRNVILLKSETCYYSDQTQKTIYVSPPPQVQILSSEPYLCSGSTIDLSSIGSGASLWSNGATGSSISISQGGLYELTLSRGGCSRSATINIVEHAAPVFSLGPDTTICNGTSLQLNSPLNMNSYTWQDGSSQFNYLVTMSGTYRVTIEDQYCAASDEIVVNMINCGAPIANFSSNTQIVCENEEVSFFDLSGNALSWSWSFPGGQPSVSTLQNPVVTYSIPGTYPVMLQATNSAGTNSIMRVQYLRVNANPTKPIITVIGYDLNSTPAENYQWMLNQSQIPGATYRTYNAIQSGNYQVEISDDNQCHAISDPVTVLITGLANLKAKGSGLTVYPNPTYGEVFIQAESGKSEKAEVRLFDNKAALLYSNNIDPQYGSPETTLDLSELASGTYFLEYRTQSGNVTGSILIKQ